MDECRLEHFTDELRILVVESNTDIAVCTLVRTLGELLEDLAGLFLQTNCDNKTRYEVESRNFTEQSVSSVEQSLRLINHCLSPVECLVSFAQQSVNSMEQSLRLINHCPSSSQHRRAVGELRGAMLIYHCVNSMEHRVSFAEQSVSCMEKSLSEVN